MTGYPSWLSKKEQLSSPPEPPVPQVPPQKEPPKPQDPVNPTRHLDKNGQTLITLKVLEILKHFESLVLVARDDGYGTPTIGYGRIVYPDGRKVRNGDRCTEAQATEWLLWDIYDKSARYVRGALLDDVENAMSDDEISIWIDLAFNRGGTRFRESMAPMLNRRDRAAALKALVGPTFTSAGGGYSLGLDRRRWCERYVLEGKDHTEFFSLAKFRAFKERGYRA